MSDEDTDELLLDFLRRFICANDIDSLSLSSRARFVGEKKEETRLCTAARIIARGWTAREERKKESPVR